MSALFQELFRNFIIIFNWGFGPGYFFAAPRLKIYQKVAFYNQEHGLSYPSYIMAAKCLQQIYENSYLL